MKKSAIVAVSIVAALAVGVAAYASNGQEFTQWVSTIANNSTNSSGNKQSDTESLPEGTPIIYAEEIVSTAAVGESENPEDSEDATMVEEGEPDVYDTITDSDLKSKAHAVNIVPEKDLPEDTKENLSEYNGDMFEFIGYDDQSISNNFRVFIASNQESNSYPVKYSFIENNKVVFESQLIQPGDAETIDLFEFLTVGKHTVDVKQTVYTNDGMQLNSLSQSIVIELYEEEDADNAASSFGEETYTSSVIYVADETKYYVTLPVVLSVKQDTYGLSFRIALKAENLKRKTELAVVINKIVLNENNVVSSRHTDTLANLIYGKKGDRELNDEFLTWFGPVYAVIQNGKMAGVNYYDTAAFRLEVTK